MAREQDQQNLNLDPISKEPGAHPVGTGLGAVAGGASAGVAAGMVGGPIGALAGGVIGAVVGGLGGKAAAEAVNPTAEEAFWRDNYDREPYYQPGRSYDDYAPAYRMGVSGYSQYNGSYEDSEHRLASEWDSRRGGSALSWPEASAASRAAWTRAGIGRNADGAGLSAMQGVVGGSARPGSRDDGHSVLGDGTRMVAEPMITRRNDDVIDVLNNLLETSRDGEYGFGESAAHAKSQDIKALLGRRSEGCRAAAAELEALVVQCGGEPEQGGTTSGAMHRGWVSLRAKLTGYSDLAMLEECERGEDVALAEYRNALKRDLPEHVKRVVEQQAQGAQRNHDQIKALRDSLRASAG